MTRRQLCLRVFNFKWENLGMDTYLSNLNRLNLAFYCEVVSTPEQVRIVAEVEKAVFPQDMQDSPSALHDFFLSEYAHGLILRYGRKAVGVLKGDHLSEENTCSELLQGDALMDIIDITFYMDSVGVMQDVRSPQVLDFLMHEMAVDLHRFDYQFVTAHARVKGGLSRLYQRRYGAKVLATYDNWCDFGEPFDYILVDLKNVPIQGLIRRSIYRLARRLYRLSE